MIFKLINSVIPLQELLVCQVHLTGSTITFKCLRIHEHYKLDFCTKDYNSLLKRTKELSKEFKNQVGVLEFVKKDKNIIY